MKVFLTGVSGFIGSHVARQLLKRGTTVMAMVRPEHDGRRIQDIHNELQLVEGTLEKCHLLQKEIARFAPDVCIHLAWQSPGKMDNDVSDRRSLAGSIRLLEMMASAGCPHFVTAGTYTEYCSSMEPVAEDSSICANTFYAKCKYEFEMKAGQVQRERGKSFCSLRLFNVYGPWDNERRMIPSIISSIRKGELCELRTGGQQIRDFSHVQDVADAFCRVADAKVQGIVNVGSSVATSSASAARLVAEMMGHPELLRLSSQPLPPHEPASLVADNTRLRRETGWSPAFDLRKGIQQTIEWHPS
jgi:nucleoside-diphosphate-sugar epimerase